MPTPGLFITGTDTDVGKTYVASLILSELSSAGVSVGPYKPACSGCHQGVDGSLVWQDVEALRSAVGGMWSIDQICPQRFQAAVAPPVAARREGRKVDGDLLRQGARWWDGRVELILVEGVGGLLCPLTDAETVADLAGDLGFPLIVVARLGLGTINHTLLTLDVAAQRGLTIAGIILNETAPAPEDDEANNTNPAEIAARTETPILSIVRFGRQTALRDLNEEKPIDWRRLARSK